MVKQLTAVETTLFKLLLEMKLNTKKYESQVINYNYWCQKVS